MDGTQIVYAWKKATVWGTPVACGAGNGFLSPPLSVKPGLVGDAVDDSLGLYFATDVSPGALTVAGDIPPYLRFNDPVVLAILAMFMGSAAAPTLHAGGAIAYDHILKINKSIDGLFGTLCTKMGALHVEEVASFKPNKIVLKFETGKPVVLVVSGLAYDLTTDSIVNTVATFANVTILEKANRAYMAQTELRMNGQADAALDAGDKVGAASVELTAERKMEGSFGTYTTGGANPRDLIDEPVNNGPWTSSLKVQLPKLLDASGYADLRTLAAKKAEIIVTGPIIEGAIPYLIKVQMPHLKPMENDAPHEQGIIKNGRDYHVLGADTDPAGMTGNTDPFWIYLTNKIATSLLA